MLAAGTDDQVRIGQRYGKKIAGKVFRGKILQAAFSLLHIGSKQSCSPGDFLPPPVIDRQAQSQLVEPGSLSDCHAKLSGNIRRNTFGIPQMAQSDLFFHDLLQLRFQETFQKAPKRFHFSFRALPVLFGEGIESEVGNAQPSTTGHDVPHGVTPLPVAKNPSAVSLSGPSPIAVHDHRDVARKSVQIELRVHQISRISFSLAL